MAETWSPPYFFAFSLAQAEISLPPPKPARQGCRLFVF